MSKNRTRQFTTVPDRERYILRARRLRNAAVTGLLRDFARWVSTTAR